MTEVWAPIPSCPGYAVSNDGRVRGPRGLLSTPATRGGYLTCSIRRNGRKFTTTVQRLVAEAFIGPAPSPLHEVNHKDGHKRHNAPDNLEWVTRQENMDHARQVLNVVHGRPRVPKPERQRKIGRFLVDDGVCVFDLELRPDPRHVGRFYASLNGEPFIHGGLEVIWREVQRKRAPVLGSRRLESYG